MVSRELIEYLLSQFKLSHRGIHGVSHWARVRDNGLRLAKITGANPTVVELFALLHDSQRHSDTCDDDHGLRAARFAAELQGKFYDLAPDDLRLLQLACEGHSRGKTQGDITVITCWDADRLDLGRVGIPPLAKYLCTRPAKDPKMIAWAYNRSLKWKERFGETDWLPVMLAELLEPPQAGSDWTKTG